MAAKRLLVMCLLVVVVVVGTGSPVFAATIWAFNPSGSNSRFGWSSGQHVTLPDTTAHGSPTVNVNGFSFENAYGDMHFRAEAGGKATVNAGVSVRVNIATATPPDTVPIDVIVVREFGTWGGVLPGPSVTADFDITEYVGGTNTGPISLPPVTFNADGTWYTQSTFVPGPGNPLGGVWTNPAVLQYFQIRVRNLIGAGAVPGTFIEKTGLQIFVPEPSSIFFMVLVLPLAFRRVRQ
jgi:hypothetical protein